MTIRVSQLYGKDIFTEKAEFVGKVGDVILNLETGEVMRLSLRPFNARELPRDEVKKIVQEESIGFDEVVKMSDILICRRNPASAKKHPHKLRE